MLILKYFLKNSNAYRYFKRNRHYQIKEILKGNHLDSQVTIKGWVKSLRNMKDTLFFDISDGSCKEHIQAVIPKLNLNKDRHFNFGSSIEALGLLRLSPRGQIELHVEKINEVGSCDLNEDFPFQPRKRYSPDYVRQFLHFRSRTNSFNSMLRIRDSLSRALQDFFYQEGFILIHTPIITTNDCEGAGEVFLIKPDNQNLLNSMINEGLSHDEAYFNTKTYLTVSGQLHLETIVRGLSKVYTFGPTFRAENSKSRHHLSEFYMIEAEIAFCESLDDLIDFLNNLFKSTVSFLLKNCSNDLATFTKIEFLEKFINEEFLILTYDEAINILSTKLKFSINFGTSLSKEHELALVKFNNDIPIYVIDWPKDLKAFYMKESPHDTSKVLALDLLVGNVGELVGGSLREDNYQILYERLKKKDLIDKLKWYLDIRKYGNVPSGGFGLGLERFLQFLLNFTSIKDTIPFPRGPHNCKL